MHCIFFKVSKKRIFVKHCAPYHFITKIRDSINNIENLEQQTSILINFGISIFEKIDINLGTTILVESINKCIVILTKSQDTTYVIKEIKRILQTGNKIIIDKSLKLLIFQISNISDQYKRFEFLLSCSEILFNLHIFIQSFIKLYNNLYIFCKQL